MTGWTRIGVDIGGTFTDVAAIEQDGHLRIGKRLTTHGSEEAGVISALGDSGVALDAEKTILAHGTTLVINALLERKGARVGLVTTAGFGDVMELGRASRPDIFNLKYRRDPVLVPPQFRFELKERTLASGEIECAPDSSAVATLAASLRDAGIDSIAVAFLNSYVNPANERAVADVLRSLLPDIPITISSDLSREWREFERFTTAAANAYVVPVADRYIATLEGELAARSFKGDFIILNSGGGAMAAATARRFPIRAVESGPVAAVLGARDLAADLAIENVVTFDMGGTTAKTCLIEGGAFAVTDMYWINGYMRGFPLQVRTVDVTEVGAGGGSIAWIDDAGRLRVGPRSAGSMPGPACYGRGGQLPTVTDANLYCGRIDPNHFSSAFGLDQDAAKKAIERLAHQADMPPERLALGILRLANISMAAAVRRQTLERGRDPREFTLIAFGGGGPMHACDVAAEVGIGKVLIPPYPGHFSALGMLNANLRVDRREIVGRRLDELDRAAFVNRLERIAADLVDELAAHGGRSGGDEVRLSYALALRYEGQDHTLLARSPTAGLILPDPLEERFREIFGREYLTRYGHVDHDARIEVVALEVVAERILPKAAMISGAVTSDRLGQLSSWFDSAAGPQMTTALLRSRGALKEGERLDGPVILHEEGATTVIPPGATACVLEGGYLLADIGTLINRQVRETSRVRPIADAWS